MIKALQANSQFTLQQGSLSPIYKDEVPADLSRILLFDLEYTSAMVANERSFVATLQMLSGIIKSRPKNIDMVLV